MRMTAALVAAVVIWWVVAVPRAPEHAEGAPNPELRRRTLAGAIHVHSADSDGTAPRSAIAAAAARAGLQFVVFTDHGDATRAPVPPTYASGVLCLDAVEISTNAGHYLAIGLPQAPYRLGGEAAAVAEDVRRLGGFGIIAHPDSTRQELAWSDWHVAADGVEWLNADSAWRSRSWPSLIRSAFGYWVRPGATLAAMLDRPVATLRRWDATTAQRPMPAFAGLDAHGGVGRSSFDGGRSGIAGIPSYDASFESFSVRAVLRNAPTGNAVTDGAALLEALRAGRTYTVIDGQATAGWIEVTAERPGGVASMGESLPGNGAASMFVRLPSLADTTVIVLRNGAPMLQTAGAKAQLTISEPGAYRVEVRRRNAPDAAPWILTNPIYMDLPSPPAEAAPTFTPQQSLLDADWRTEHDPASTAELAHTGSAIELTYRLDPGQRSPFAALVVPLDHATPFSGVSVTLSSDPPTRVSLQFRSADGRERWRRSIIGSAPAHPVTLAVSDFVPISPTGRALEPSVAASLLIVVDLVNSVPGARGRIVLHQLSLGRVE